jgi:hypothetical protein
MSQGLFLSPAQGKSRFFFIQPEENSEKQKWTEHVPTAVCPLDPTTKFDYKKFLKSCFNADGSTNDLLTRAEEDPLNLKGAEKVLLPHASDGQWHQRGRHFKEFTHCTNKQEKAKAGSFPLLDGAPLPRSHISFITHGTHFKEVDRVSRKGQNTKKQKLLSNKYPADFLKKRKNKK